MQTFKSDFALLDVKDGRDTLALRVLKDGPVKIQVEMTVDCQWGDDDGVSREFGCVVHSVKEIK